jgi:hypothetical protein
MSAPPAGDRRRAGSSIEWPVIFARLGLPSEFWRITGDPAEPQK